MIREILLCLVLMFGFSVHAQDSIAGAPNPSFVSTKSSHTVSNTSWTDIPKCQLKFVGDEIKLFEHISDKKPSNIPMNNGDVYPPNGISDKTRGEIKMMRAKIGNKIWYSFHVTNQGPDIAKRPFFISEPDAQDFNDNCD